MANGTINYPFPNFNFLVELDGITRAAFHECTGISSTVNVIEYNEGGSLYNLKLPGRVTYANIVLRYGMTSGDMELYNWHLGVVQGNIQRKNGSILQLDAAGNQVARWDFTQAWPTKCNGPDLNAEDNKIAFESYEIACTTLQRVQ
jgi:phage tail-like protein